MTDEELIVAYSAYQVTRGRRPRTVESCAAALRRMLIETGSTMETVTREQVQAWIDGRNAAATKRVYLAHARGFFEWALDEGHLTVNPARRVHAPKIPRREPHPMPEMDLARAMKDAPPDVRAWMLLAAEAGLRACEIALVRGEHVMEYPTPRLFLPETKGGGEASVPLSDTLLAELKRWPDRGPLWGEGVTYDEVSRRVSKHLRSHGIPPTYRLHSLRHRFATMVYATNGHDLRETQELLRHASPATTAVYAAIDPSKSRTTVNGLPRIA